MSYQGDFDNQIKQFSQDAINNFLKVRNGAAVELFNRVVLDTPVGNPSLWKSKKAPKGYVGGRLRGNWQATIGSPATGDVDRIRDAAEVQAEINSTHGGSNSFQTLWLVNNLPYAHRVEYGNWSTQAPSGMVRKNVMALQKIVDKKAREL